MGSAIVSAVWMLHFKFGHILFDVVVDLSVFACFLVLISKHLTFIILEPIIGGLILVCLIICIFAITIILIVIVFHIFLIFRDDWLVLEPICVLVYVAGHLLVPVFEGLYILL